MPPPNTPVQAAAVPIPATPRPGPREPSSLAEGYPDIPGSRSEDPEPYLPHLPSAYTEPPYLRSSFRKVNEDGLPTQDLENLELVHHIDHTMLIYFGDPDENLVCDICRLPFYDAVMTSCLHIYCRKCLTDALYFNGNVCPTDRTRIDENSIRKAPSNIQKQVDALRVECPACCKLMSRSSIQHHLATTCLEARMLCPGRLTDKHCKYQILRKNLTDQCLHYTSLCDDCGLSVLMIDMDSHKLEKCEERNISCTECGKEYAKITTEEHKEQCPEIVICCQWASLGCDFTSRRKGIGHHHETCGHRFTGSVVDNLISQMDSLRFVMDHKVTARDSRIKELEAKTRAVDVQLRDLSRPVDESSELFHNQLMSGNIFPQLADGDQDTTQAFNDIYPRIDRLEQRLVEYEGRQSVMALNEIVALRNDLLELRSAQQLTASRVTWLLNLRNQENRQRRTALGFGSGVVGGGTAGGNNDGSDSGGESSYGSPGRRVSRGPRRSNDSLHEPPRL